MMPPLLTAYYPCPALPHRYNADALIVASQLVSYFTGLMVALLIALAIRLVRKVSSGIELLFSPVLGLEIIAVTSDISLAWALSVLYMVERRRLNYISS